MYYNLYINDTYVNYACLKWVHHTLESENTTKKKVQFYKEIPEQEVSSQQTLQHFFRNPLIPVQ